MSEKEDAQPQRLYLRDAPPTAAPRRKTANERISVLSQGNQFEMVPSLDMKTKLFRQPQKPSAPATAQRRNDDNQSPSLSSSSIDSSEEFRENDDAQRNSPPASPKLQTRSLIMEDDDSTQEQERGGLRRSISRKLLGLSRSRKEEESDSEEEEDGDDEEEHDDIDDNKEENDVFETDEDGEDQENEDDLSPTRSRSISKRLFRWGPASSKKNRGRPATPDMKESDSAIEVTYKGEKDGNKSKGGRWGFLSGGNNYSLRSKSSEDNGGVLEQAISNETPSDMLHTDQEKDMGQEKDNDNKNKRPSIFGGGRRRQLELENANLKCKLQEMENDALRQRLLQMELRQSWSSRDGEQEPPQRQEAKPHCVEESELLSFSPAQQEDNIDKNRRVQFQTSENGKSSGIANKDKSNVLSKDLSKIVSVSSDALEEGHDNGQLNKQPRKLSGSGNSINSGSLETMEVLGEDVDEPQQAVARDGDEDDAGTHVTNTSMTARNPMEETSNAVLFDKSKPQVFFNNLMCTMSELFNTDTISVCSTLETEDSYGTRPEKETKAAAE